jgi:hypothetical protein
MALESTAFVNVKPVPSAALSNAITPTFSMISTGIENGQAKQQLENTVSSLSGGGGGIISGVGNLLTGVVGGVGGMISSAVGAVGGGVSDVLSAAGSLAQGDFSAFSGKVSAAAGNLNDILSMKRGASIPSGAELFAQTGTPILLSPGARNDWRVRLNAPWEIFNSDLFKPLEETGGVVWPYLPNITLTTKATYTNPDVVHNNYAFQAYKNSQVEEITITGEFTCETEIDAAYWISATTFFKTATKMFFGTGANAGNPPIICNLSGYGRSMFNSIPVVVKSFSVDLKDSVNYIRCDAYKTTTWVPIISTITVVVSPVYNRTTIRQFSMHDYAAGKTLTAKGIGYL